MKRYAADLFTFALSTAVTATIACGAGSAGHPGTNLAAASAAPQPAGVLEIPAGSVVSSEFGFAIRPAVGWQLIDGERAREIDERAAAGALSTDGRLTRRAFVIVQPALGLGIDALTADSHTVQHRHTLGRLVSRERIRFAGQDAIRTRRLRQLEGAPREEVDVTFVNRGIVYDIAFVGVTLDEDEVERLLRSFVLLPGAVSIPWLYPVASDSVGPGWRVRGDRYESAESGLIVTLAPGWRYLTPASTFRLNPNADVCVTSRSGDTLTMITERVPASEHAAFRSNMANHMRTSLGAPAADGGIDVTIAGQHTHMDLYPSPGRQGLHTTICERELCTQVILDHASTDERDASTAMAQAPRIAFAPDAEQAALLASMPPRNSTIRIVRADQSFRRRRFVDYPNGVTLDLPDTSHWIVRAGGEAQDVRDTLSLVFIDHRRGLAGFVMSERLTQAMTTQAHHAAVRRSIGLAATTTPPQILHAGPTSALASSGDAVSDEIRQHYEVATAVRGDLGFRLVVTGYAANVSAARDVVAAIRAGWSIAAGALPETAHDGDRWSSERFGYAVTLPASWTHRDATDHVNRGSGRRENWTGPDGELYVVASGVEPGSETALHNTMRDMVRARAPGVIAPDALWEPTTLAGQPASQLSWQAGNISGRLVMHVADRVMYTIVSTHPQGMPDPTERFELLP